MGLFGILLAQQISSKCPRLSQTFHTLSQQNTSKYPANNIMIARKCQHIILARVGADAILDVRPYSHQVLGLSSDFESYYIT